MASFFNKKNKLMNILLLLKGGKGSCVAKQKVDEANLPVSFIYVLKDYVVDGYGDGAVNKSVTHCVK